MATLISELIDKIQRRSNRVDSTFRERALDALDEAQAWYSKAVPWESLRRMEDFVTSGSEFLVFPDRVLKIISIGDKTNSRMLEPGDHFGRRNRGAYFNRTAGRLCEWRDLGLVPVQTQPETLTTVQVRSTVSDTYSVFVRGLAQDTTASGTALENYEIEETISITSSDTVTSSETFVEILAIQKDRPTNGDLVVNYTFDSRRASRIPSWEARPLFPRVQLFFVPSPQATMEVEYFRRPDRVTSENSSIDPSMDEEALVWRATGNLHWLDNEGQPAQLAWQKAEQILAAKKNVEDSFGEKDMHIEPLFPSYFDVEHVNWWTDGP